MTKEQLAEQYATQNFEGASFAKAAFIAGFDACANSREVLSISGPENFDFKIPDIIDTDGSAILHKDWPLSSNVNFTKYYPGQHILEVNFKSGSYQYGGVPFDIWSELCAAESVGSFIAKNVKGKFQSVKL